MVLNQNSQFKVINTLCEQRNVCHSYCITDSFPDSVCDKRDQEIEYNGNKYSKFFYYPNPVEHF